MHAWMESTGIREGIKRPEMAAFLYTVRMARAAHFQLSAVKGVHRRSVVVGLFACLVLCGGAAIYSLPMQLPLMVLATMLLGYWVAVRGRDSVREILLAALFALFITTQHTYVYENFNLYVGWVNVYPLLLWTVSLVTLKQLYAALPSKDRFIGASLTYLVLLFMLEALGYYVFGIRTAGGYPSLLGTGIIHGPPIIHLFYVSAGPLYLWVIKRLGW